MVAALDVHILDRYRRDITKQPNSSDLGGLSSFMPSTIRHEANRHP